MTESWEYRRYHARRDAGMCPRCGKEPADHPAVYCRTCINRMKEYRRSATAAAVRERELAMLAELKKKYPVKRPLKKKAGRKGARR